MFLSLRFGLRLNDSIGLESVGLLGEKLTFYGCRRGEGSGMTAMSFDILCCTLQIGMCLESRFTL